MNYVLHMSMQSWLHTNSTLDDGSVGENDVLVSELARVGQVSGFLNTSKHNHYGRQVANDIIKRWVIFLY